jgi:serine/threonine-protein kinase ULK4
MQGEEKYNVLGYF